MAIPSHPDVGALSTDPEAIATLEAIAQRVLWLSTYMIHYANRLRPNPDGMKVGGHQASCASVVNLLTALSFAVLRPQDHIAVKPHAAPVYHAIQYLLGRLPRHFLATLRDFGGLQAYPSRTKDPDAVTISTGSVTAPVRRSLEWRSCWRVQRSEGTPRMLEVPGYSGKAVSTAVKVWKRSKRIASAAPTAWRREEARPGMAPWYRNRLRRGTTAMKDG